MNYKPLLFLIVFVLVSYVYADDVSYDSDYFNSYSGSIGSLPSEGVSGFVDYGYSEFGISFSGSIEGCSYSGDTGILTNKDVSIKPDKFRETDIKALPDGGFEINGKEITGDYEADSLELADNGFSYDGKEINGDYESLKIIKDGEYEIDGHKIYTEGSIDYEVKKDSLKTTYTFKTEKYAEIYPEKKDDNIFAEKVTLNEGGEFEMTYSHSGMENADIKNGKVELKFSKEMFGETRTLEASVTDFGDGTSIVFSMGGSVSLRDNNVNFQDPFYWDEEYDGKHVIFAAQGKGFVVETPDHKWVPLSDEANIEIDWHPMHEGEVLKATIDQPENLPRGPFGELTHYTENNLPVTDYFKVDWRGAVVWDGNRKQIGKYMVSDETLNIPTMIEVVRPEDYAEIYFEGITLLEGGVVFHYATIDEQGIELAAELLQEEYPKVKTLLGFENVELKWIGFVDGTPIGDVVVKREDLKKSKIPIIGRVIDLVKGSIFIKESRQWGFTGEELFGSIYTESAKENLHKQHTPEKKGYAIRK